MSFKKNPGSVQVLNLLTKIFYAFRSKNFAQTKLQRLHRCVCSVYGFFWLWLVPLKEAAEQRIFELSTESKAKGATGTPGHLLTCSSGQLERSCCREARNRKGFFGADQLLLPPLLWTRKVQSREKDSPPSVSHFRIALVPLQVLIRFDMSSSVVLSSETWGGPGGRGGSWSHQKSWRGRQRGEVGQTRPSILTYRVSQKSD